MERFNIAIVGSGPAGITAAITARIRNKSIVLIGQKCGSNKVSSAAVIKNYPGLPDVTGATLSKNLLNHLNAMQISITEDKISCIYAMGKYFVLKAASGTDYEASSVILACGVDFVKPLKGEKDFIGRGVSYCATCDGMFYKDKAVCVLAYEKNAIKEVKYLAELCRKVFVFKCFTDIIEESLPVNVTVIAEKPLEIKGSLKADVLVTEKGEYKTDGIFILRQAVAPDSLVPGLKTENGYVVADRQMKTSIAGCFACGDVTGVPYQYIKAAGEGNVAALSAVSYLSEL